MKSTNEYFYKYHFKVAAVKTANHPHIQTQAVAEALNIHPFMLSRWKKQYREGVLKKDNGPGDTTELTNELAAAKRTIDSLQQRLKRALAENQVLKKTERVFPKKK